MPKAYVGIVCSHGLAVLQPEPDDTLLFARRSGLDAGKRVGFWAVLGDLDARCVQALVVSGNSREALWLLGRTAKDIGPILPSDGKLSHVH